MEKITINASTDYEVIIGSGMIKEAGAYIAAAFEGKSYDPEADVLRGHPGLKEDKPKGNGKLAVIVSDDNVFPLYGEIVKESLHEAGFKTLDFFFPHGEKSKNLKVYGELLEFMCDNHVRRSDFIVALGGGVVGDLAGFAAATYQRGIDFVQIPTTLLAAVDSSVGGKTAVDLTNGKNQVGAFYQPRLVLCDTDTLKTLPPEEYACGCGEIIKYAVLESEEFFDELLEKQVYDQYEHVVSTCVKMKKNYVENDEFDRGLRMKLNLGHTIGHAVEACSGYTILHGQAVAMGMAAVTKAAVSMGLCSKEILARILEILDVYKLPSNITFDPEEMLDVIKVDKKNAGDTTSLIVPVSIGNCRIMRIPTEKLIGWIEEGLA